MLLYRPVDTGAPPTAGLASLRHARADRCPQRLHAGAPPLLDILQRHADVWRDGRRGPGAGGAPARDGLVRTRSKKPQSIHLIQVRVAGANGSSQNIVSKR